MHVFFLVGEILATYEENTRDFLFPDPKLTSRHHGVDREILMKRSSYFTVSECLQIVFMVQCASVEKPLELLQNEKQFLLTDFCQFRCWMYKSTVVLQWRYSCFSSKCFKKVFNVKKLISTWFDVIPWHVS